MTAVAEAQTIAAELDRPAPMHRDRMDFSIRLDGWIEKISFHNGGVPCLLPSFSMALQGQPY